MTPRKRRDRLNSIREIAVQLQHSDDAAAPDLTQSILARVDATRPFLDRKTRNMLWVGRAALGLSVATIVLGAALVQRWAPDAVELVARPAPLSTVVESVKTNATERLVVLREAVAGTVAADASTDVFPASFDVNPSGGLLTLVSSAAPMPTSSDVASSSTVPHTCCKLCGPMLPPSRAAQIVTTSFSGGGSQSQPMSLSAAKSSVSMSMAFETSWLSPRVRVSAGAPAVRTVATARLAANATPAVGRRIVLNELAPLGAGASGESALAPK